MSDPVVYMSTDTSALTLNGTAGSFYALIKAIAIGTSGTAYGSKPSLGWTSVYDNSSNKIAIRSSSASSPQPRFRFDDSGGGTGGARQCFLRGYAAMSDVDTGTGAFPTTGQSTPGVVIRKSATADSTARPWIIIGDERTIHILISHGQSSGDYDYWYIGDVTPAIPSDTYCAIVGGRTVDEVSATNGANYLTTLRPTLTEAPAAGGGAWAMASIDGATASLALSAMGMFGIGSLSATILSGAFSVPLAAGVVAARTCVQEKQSPWYLRGPMRGLWHSLNSNATRPAVGDIVGNLGADGARQGIVIRLHATSGYGTTGWCIVQTTDWDV